MNFVERIKPNLKDKRKAPTFAKARGGMIYFMTERNGTAIKIGHTNNLRKRLSEYRTHSTMFVLIDAIPGTEEDEKKYQQKLLDMGFTHYYDDPKTEWLELPCNWKKERIYKGFKIFEKNKENA